MRKTASSSGRPIERSSCCWVPSPQSNSSRSPPARSSSAGSPRRAEGTEPAVPAKKSERSIGRATLERGWARDAAPRLERDELELQPAVARGREPHRVRGRAPALGRRARVEDLEAARACSCSGRCEWPNTTASASGKRRRSRARRPSAGPPSWSSTIRAPSASTSRTRGSRIRSAGSSTLPCTACTGGPSDSQQLEHLERDEVAGVQDRVRGAAAARRRPRAARRAPRHVRVADDRELHAALSSHVRGRTASRTPRRGDKRP